MQIGLRTVQKCKGRMREYRVWSIEYRERQNSTGAPWGDRIVGCGHMTEALIPVSGFPLSTTLPATCHLPPETMVSLGYKKTPYYGGCWKIRTARGAVPTF